MSSQRGQVLVFVALVLPLVLLPAAAFAVDAASAAAAHANLEQATASGAEAAAQQIDATALRAGAGIVLDRRSVDEIARQVVTAADPGAIVERVSVDGLYVTVEATESLPLPLNFLGSPTVTLHAIAGARLALGYDRPRSFLPFSVSTF
jgi:hypothetical protein